MHVVFTLWLFLGVSVATLGIRQISPYPHRALYDSHTHWVLTNLQLPFPCLLWELKFYCQLWVWVLRSTPSQENGKKDVLWHSLCNCLFNSWKCHLRVCFYKNPFLKVLSAWLSSWGEKKQQNESPQSSLWFFFPDSWILLRIRLVTSTHSLHLLPV